MSGESQVRAANFVHQVLCFFGHGFDESVPVEVRVLVLEKDKQVFSQACDCPRGVAVFVDHGVLVDLCGTLCLSDDLGEFDVVLASHRSLLSVVGVAAHPAVVVQSFHSTMLKKPRGPRLLSMYRLQDAFEL